PVGRALARVAVLADLLRVDIPVVESLVADRAGARLARTVRAALTRFAALPTAADLVGVFGAGFLVGQDRPVEGVLVGIADLAVVVRIGLLRGDVVVADVAETLPAGIEEATLVLRAALAGATASGPVRAARHVTLDRRPIEPGAARIADLADVVRVG